MPTKPPSDIAIAMMVATVAYLFFHVGAIHAGNFGPRRGWWRRFLGIPLLMGVPLIVIAATGLPGPEALGLNFNDAGTSLLLAAATILALAPLLVLQSRKPSFLKFYPEVRLPRWTATDHLKNALSWTSYLLAYEFFFRGFMLLLLASVMEPTLALVLMTMAYALAHIDRYPGELFGTLFTGLGFGLVTLETGSLMMPWLAHAGLAVTTDLLAARATARQNV